MAGQRGFLKIDAAAIGLCVLASLAFYRATVRPCLERQGVAAAQHEQLKARQDAAAQMRASVSKAQERLAAAQDQLAAGAIQLEPATHVNKRVAGLTQFFSDCGLEVDDVQTAAVSSAPQYDLVPITVTGRGSYNRCVGFFRGLAVTFPDMSVTQVELAGSPEPTGTAPRFQFDLLWYAAPSRSALQDTVGAPEPESPVAQNDLSDAQRMARGK